MNDAREQAERTADRVRAELISTLQELDRRRHRALDVRYQLEKHFSLVVAVAAGIGLLGAGTLVVAIARSRARRDTLMRDRVRGFMRVWDNPERIANAEGVANPASAARKLAMAVAVTLATQLAKRGVQHLLPSNSAHRALS